MYLGGNRRWVLLLSHLRLQLTARLHLKLDETKNGIGFTYPCDLKSSIFLKTKLIIYSRFCTSICNGCKLRTTGSEEKKTLLLKYSEGPKLSIYQLAGFVPSLLIDYISFS